MNSFSRLAKRIAQASERTKQPCRPAPSGSTEASDQPPGVFLQHHSSKERSPAAVLLCLQDMCLLPLCIAHRLTQILAPLAASLLAANLLATSPLQAPCRKFAPVRSGARTSAVCAARGFHRRRKRGRSRRRRGLCATKFARCAELCVQLHFRREFAARK